MIIWRKCSLSTRAEKEAAAKKQQEQEQLRRMGVEILPINLEKYYAMLGDIYQYESDRMLYQPDAELDRVMRSDSVKETF